MGIKIGIIGGSGIYDPEILENTRVEKIGTPYGAPSDLVTIGTLQGREVIFIPRHGYKHSLNPTNVNYRANIYAMKKLGVTHILAPSAVGSLKEEIKPGDIVFTDQFIDMTKRREQSFYTTGEVCHISVAEPFCPVLRELLINEASRLGINYHPKGTCVVIEGPRFSTKAESNLFRSWDCDIINMTLVPEVILAREAEICYANIAMVTDYDVWRDHPVTNKEVTETMKKNVEKIKLLLKETIPKISETRTCSCKDALKNALI